MKFTFLFPGQGAQVVGMGKEFFDHHVAAREVFQEADELLGRPLSKTIFEGPVETLTETRNSQTGIYVTSLAMLRVLEKQFPQIKPTTCAGLSLGEYTALTASGRIGFQKGLPLVQFRGEAMNRACEKTQGTMAALFGLSAEAVEALVRELDMPHDLWAANFNSPGQTVISGTLKGVEAGIEEAKKRGAKRAIPLKVHGAFHSGLMQFAKEQLAPLIQEVEILESPVRLVMNVSGNFVEKKEEIRSLLIQQVTSPIRWEQGVRAMLPFTELFIEIGCGKTLAGMNKQIDPSIPTISINTLKDLDQLAAYVG